MHCGASGKVYASELSTEQIKDAIKQASKIGTKVFSVTGGEPLLRHDLVEVIKFAKRLGIVSGVATNGYLLTENTLLKLLDAGVKSIQISLDGPSAIHNAIRRNNIAYDKTINTIKLCVKYNVPKLQVATVVTPLNIEYLDRMLKILKTIGVKKWRLGVVMPIGRADNSMVLRGTKLRKLFEFIQKNQSAMTIYIAENLTFLGEYEELIRSEPLNCPAGITTCTIGVTGNVRGCPELPDIKQFVEGNILKESLASIWHNKFQYYRKSYQLKDDSKCRSCKFKYNCWGGCRVMRISNNHCILG